MEPVKDFIQSDENLSMELCKLSFCFCNQKNRRGSNLSNSDACWAFKFVRKYQRNIASDFSFWVNAVKDLDLHNLKDADYRKKALKLWKRFNKDEAVRKLLLQSVDVGSSSDCVVTEGGGNDKEAENSVPGFGKGSRELQTSSSEDTKDPEEDEKLSRTGFELPCETKLAILNTRESDAIRKGSLTFQINVDPSQWASIWDYRPVNAFKKKPSSRLWAGFLESRVREELPALCLAGITGARVNARAARRGSSAVRLYGKCAFKSTGEGEGSEEVCDVLLFFTIDRIPRPNKMVIISCKASHQCQHNGKTFHSTRIRGVGRQAAAKELAYRLPLDWEFSKTSESDPRTLFNKVRPVGICVSSKIRSEGSICVFDSPFSTCHIESYILEFKNQSTFDVQVDLDMLEKVIDAQLPDDIEDPNVKRKDSCGWYNHICSFRNKCADEIGYTKDGKPYPGGQVNRYHNPKVVDAFLKLYACITPLWASFVPVLVNRTYTPTTNGLQEFMFGVTKNNLMQYTRLSLAELARNYAFKVFGFLLKLMTRQNIRPRELIKRKLSSPKKTDTQSKVPKPSQQKVNDDDESTNHEEVWKRRAKSTRTYGYTSQQKTLQGIDETSIGDFGSQQQLAQTKKPIARDDNRSAVPAKRNKPAKPIQQSVELALNTQDTIAVVVGKRLEEGDLATVLGNKWMNSFAIDFYANILMQTINPRNIVYVSTQVFSYSQGGFHVSNYWLGKCKENLTDETNVLVAVCNYGAHWVLVVADKVAKTISMADTLRGRFLSPARVDEGIDTYKTLLKALIGDITWEFKYYKNVALQKDGSSCGPAALYLLEKFMKGIEVVCTDPNVYVRYRKTIITRCLRTTPVGTQILTTKNKYSDFLAMD